MFIQEIEINQTSDIMKPLIFMLSLYFVFVSTQFGNDPGFSSPWGSLIGVPKLRHDERNSEPEFEFISLSSRIEESYSAFPEKSTFEWNMTSGMDALYGDACDIQLSVTLIDYMQTPGDSSAYLCLYKEDVTDTSNLFSGNSKFSVLGMSHDPVAYYKALQPVTGFVMGEYSSLVTGFLIDQFFYGSIRMYDPLPGHNVIFYVEPIRNLGLYNGNLVDLEPTEEKNAVLFEYVRHEDGTFPQKPASVPAGGGPAPALTPSKSTDTDYPDFETKALENVNTDETDIFEHTIIKPGSSDHQFFDTRRNSTLTCEACIWVQPNLAKKYGLGNGVPAGVGEIISVLKFVQHIYQGLDFNRDGFADELQLVITNFIVTDSIDVFESDDYVRPNKAPSTANKPASTAASPAGGSSPDPSASSTKTDAASANTGPSSTNVDGTSANPGPVSPGSAPPEATSSRKKRSTDGVEEAYKEDVKNLTPKGAYASVQQPLADLFAGQSCCVILGYIYHNLAPKIAVASHAGACSKRHAVGIISGFLHDHKIAKYDLYRATMHALGHLFGANMDSNSDPRCKVDLVNTPSIFNQLLMDNYHKTDIGIRPNSMRYSPCAKTGISNFLTSANANCFKASPKSETPYCGNGIIERGEECDCGLLWQCHLSELKRPACCGESDSFLGCTRLGNAKFQQTVSCHRPWDW